MSAQSPAHPVIAIYGSELIELADEPAVYAALDQELELSRALDQSPRIQLTDAIGVALVGLRWARERGLDRTIAFSDADGYQFWVDSRGLLGDDAERAELVAGASAHPGGRLIAETHRNAQILEGATAIIAIWTDQFDPLCRNARISAHWRRIPMHEWIIDLPGVVPACSACDLGLDNPQFQPDDTRASPRPYVPLS